MTGPRPPRILLIGLMATGKSTIGRHLATVLGIPYLDNDELVKQATGVERENLLRAQGEAALRRAETAALDAVLARPGPLVAGIAAGVVLDEGNRARLRAADALVVWLRARPETLAARIAADHERAARPWVDQDPVAVLRTMARERAAWYDEVADLVVDVDDLDPAAVVARILAA